MPPVASTGPHFTNTPSPSTSCAAPPVAAVGASSPCTPPAPPPRRASLNSAIRCRLADSRPLPHSPAFPSPAESHRCSRPCRHRPCSARDADSASPNPRAPSCSSFPIDVNASGTTSALDREARFPLCSSSVPVGQHDGERREVSVLKKAFRRSCPSGCDAVPLRVRREALACVRSHRPGEGTCDKKSPRDGVAAVCIHSRRSFDTLSLQHRDAMPERHERLRAKRTFRSEARGHGLCSVTANALLVEPPPRRISRCC